jgi:putative endonuclease
VELGRRAEALAERHLEGRGLTILDRRFRAGRGELDLVALDGETVVFVEVRGRRPGEAGSPEESLTPAKQARIASAARVWLAARGESEPFCRFDLVAVDWTEGGPEIRHLEDAFRPG